MELANKLRIPFFETSGRFRKNIDEIFKSLISEIENYKSIIEKNELDKNKKNKNCIIL
jgi:GTPase SAR1 family protein